MLFTREILALPSLHCCVREGGHSVLCATTRCAYTALPPQLPDHHTLTCSTDHSPFPSPYPSLQPPQPADRTKPRKNTCEGPKMTKKTSYRYGGVILGCFQKSFDFFCGREPPTPQKRKNSWF